jgi:hypothetical protein
MGAVSATLSSIADRGHSAAGGRADSPASALVAADLACADRENLAL